jgi:phenylacetate-coenzyme A ligase PaaK-like adenylate-forming protein
LESIAAEQAFIDALLEPHGLTMRSRMAVLRSDNIKPPGDRKPPYGRISHNGQRLTLSSPHLCAETIAWFHTELERFKPSIVWIYPSMGVNLLKLMQQARRVMEIPVILASSEELHASTHTALESYFHAKVINYYGQAERVCFAYSTRAGEFYFAPAYGKVELGEPERLGDGLACPVIASNYWNLAMPLLRYATGDMVYVPEGSGRRELEEIAQGKRAFLGIAGREGEYLLTRDGMKLIGLNQIPREIKNIFQMQLVQKDFDLLEIHVIAMPGFGEADAREIEAQARPKIPASMQVKVIVVDRLFTTARGKTPLVMREC